MLQPHAVRRATPIALLLLATAIAAACHSDSVSGPSSQLLSPTCGAGGVVSLSVNTATTLACTSGNYINLAGGAKYLLVPQFASGGLGSGIPDTPVPYVLGVPGGTPQDITVNNFNASLAPSGATPGPAANAPASAQRAFDAMMMSRARAAVARPGWRRLAPFGATGGSASMRAAIAQAATPALGSLRTFNILAGSDGNYHYTTTTAQLSYIGSNILMYIDTLAPAGGFSPQQLQSFGQYFDQVLYGLDVSAFGPPSDVDGNGHVIMLLSPDVNALTSKATCSTQGYVAGYFDSNDLSATSTSNQAEMFYTVVPDPNGTYSCAQTVDDMINAVPATFLHELQHLISFSQHVVVHGGNPEEGWLDEGMSIRAEELGSEYFEAKYPPPTGRSSPAQLFPDSAEGFVEGFLSDSYAYLLRTDTASLTLHDDSENGFSWRGGDWLLVHWLGDLKGKSVFAKLEQSNVTGIDNLVAAAGEPFGALFGDFSTAMWTDSIVGVPRSAIPTPDRLQTRNLRQLYQRYYDTGGGSVPRPYPVLPTVLTSTSLASASMVPGTMAFYTLDLTNHAGNLAIEFAQSGGTAFKASLGAQVSIYRLP